MIRALTLILSVAFVSQACAKAQSQSAADAHSESLAALQTSETYIPVSKSLSLYVRYVPATAGKPTLVVLNGLTHTTENWNTFFKHFERNGSGILQIDLAGQGKTLAKHGAVRAVIRYQDQSAYVALVLKHLNISSKINLLGLSYGGGIATYFASQNPQLIERLIILAPYTEPQPDQDKWIRDQIRATRIAFPYNTATDDELYDYFLKQLVYNTYPIAEPELLRIPYKLEAVYRMAQGIRKLYTAKHLHVLPAQSVFLVCGASDQVVKPAVLDSFWAAVPAQARASRMIIKGTDHDLIKLQPKLVAKWVERILARDPETLSGKVIEVDRQ